MIRQAILYCFGWAVVSFTLVVVYSNHIKANSVVAETFMPERDPSPITPLLVETTLDPDIIVLGNKLFHDARLSADNSISCAHCHDLVAGGGADNRPFSHGIKGRSGVMNAPTVYNVRYNFSQFWDGRAATLEEQIDGPIHNRVEMGSTWPQIISKLQKDQSYVQQFRKSYGVSGICSDNIKNALAVFQRSLVTVNSPFDQFLQGDESALSVAQKKGYKLFIAYGCISCHQGANVGGNMFQKIGVFGSFEDIVISEEGILKNTSKALGADADDLILNHKRVKVPSLRLVSLTAPYFHDGSVKSLQGAIRVMARYQLGRAIKDQDVELMAQFLTSLVGPLPVFEQGQP